MKGASVLDLTLVRNRVAQKLSWDEEYAARVEREYKMFLDMAAGATRVEVSSADVDELWHAHILDTRKYAEDCEMAYGRFVHHVPHYGDWKPGAEMAAGVCSNTRCAGGGPKCDAQTDGPAP